MVNVWEYTVINQASCVVWSTSDDVSFYQTIIDSIIALSLLKLANKQ